MLGSCDVRQWAWMKSGGGGQQRCSEEAVAYAGFLPFTALFHLLK